MPKRIDPDSPTMASKPKAAVVIIPALVALIVWLVVYWAAPGPPNL